MDGVQALTALVLEALVSLRGLPLKGVSGQLKKRNHLRGGDENRETEIGIWSVRALVTNTGNPRKYSWAENQRDDSWDRVGFDWRAHTRRKGFGNQHWNWNGAICHSQWQWRV